jgi:leucine dehydrogenase
MALLSQWTEHVVGRPTGDGGSGDPGAFTAAGVEAAMRACCGAVFGSRSLADRTVAIVGVGSVGSALAHTLAARGAKLVLADIDGSKRALARELNAEWMDCARALRAGVDVLAPCALGGVIDQALTGELRCRIICGSANNQLAGDELAEALAERGILYAPDFIVNAAGLINASMELTGYEIEEARRRAEGIEAVLGEILAEAAIAQITPLRAATARARRRLAQARTSPGARARRPASALPRISGSREAPACLRSARPATRPDSIRAGRGS